MGSLTRLYLGIIPRIHTINVVHPLNLEHERATGPLDQVVIKFIPFGRRCELGTGETRKRMEEQAIDYSP